ncbi:MAG: 3-octaprenyl-4-hydroxybenzoate carboxy-lyase [Rhodospirillaceae bacterium]|jgi:4-hydroxy-3-polyprenylbenzoate decarboxylase|uniref:UbiX family flavin prenyltransferase n=1 Tax=Hwanghaeella sp. 1Z406 TaxID=3402811 RepID=UPI000C4ABA65|nr:3-octaprenyl-4-hydroxybenzoate carboxy-lyase [Rhodospirillales bacterium]MAX48580.1 3-octaprenyl-4-hydroxybenzoate carboxy-lyase [Rhodospirillaceae bacterium]|tara:strand:+ start:108660 stop:109253 length:594 start_codon:yes stop_codon:yes gene_type:complete
MVQRKLVVGISGASGVVYGIRLLQALRTAGVETHLILSKAAEMTLAYETDLKPRDVRALADVSYAIGDVGAPCASGSFPSDGMVIAPCSMKTLAEIATGVTANLLSRAADVVLKERRRLVLMARETPLTLVHLRNMTTVTEMGGIIAPPVPAFYAKPDSLDDMVDHSVGRVLDLFGIQSNLVRRWKTEDVSATQSER